MSYIGNQPTSVAFLTDSFSGNSTDTVFTMSVAPATTSSILVAITGVVQDPSTYSVSGTTLTFSAAPPSGTGNISVRYLGIPASGVTTTAYRTVTEFTATAGQTTFTPPSYTVGYLNVYMNGVLLGSADYTATNGTTVVLASGAVLGALITTESFYVSSVLNAIPATAGSVGSSYIANDAVGAAQIAAGAVGTSELADANVTQAKLGTNVAGNGPAFSAYVGSAQSLAGLAFTKMMVNTEEFDTASCFDSTTNYRFTPNVAGYYLIEGQIAYTSTINAPQLVIYKNGSGFKNGSNPATGNWANVSAIVYLNGSTDYVELYGANTSAGSSALSISSQQNYFQGTLIRAA